MVFDLKLLFLYNPGRLYTNNIVTLSKALDQERNPVQNPKQ